MCRQKVFVITNIERRCLKFIFKAFNLNRDMLMEMSLKQEFTKIVPFTDAESKDAIVGSQETAATQGDLEARYWYMNLAYRWQKSVLEMDTIKVIYNRHDAMIFIFCSTHYQEWFRSDLMKGNFDFVLDPDL